MNRVLVPEILDGLAPADPRAIRSRRDLARINFVMRQSAIMARALKGFAPPRVLADLGGGDGRFLLAVARRLAKRWPNVTAIVCDQADIVSTGTRQDFARLGWTVEVRQGDVFNNIPRADIAMTNLFLHHFEDAQLARLLALAAQNTSAFAACEPRRNAFAVLGARMVWALGANAVTRHDALASVRAGFAGQELSLLWPLEAARWHLAEHYSFPFTHVFTAHA